MAKLPPDTRAVGTPDPAGDMDNVIDALAVITGATPGGADPGSGTVTTQQAMDTLAGGTTSGRYMRGNGTHVVLDTLQAADMTGTLAAAALPAATTSAQGAVILDGTATDIKAPGTQAAGASTKAAAGDHVHPAGAAQWLPGDDGFLGANSDPAYASGGGLLTAGTLYLARIIPRVSQTITNLWVCVSTIGAGTSTGTFVGLYSSSGGAPLSTSTDCASSFTGTTGWKSIALQAAQNVTAGSLYYAGELCNLGTTQVNLLRQNNSQNSAPQASANTAQLRWAQQASFGTTMGSVTLSSSAATAVTIIVLWS
jgi:hypothetical protein